MDTTRPSLLVRVRDPADVGAWSEFDRAYRPVLWQYARACGLNTTDAEDLVQQCFAEVCKHIRGLEYDPAKGRFRSWLGRIVKTRALNLLRRHRERQADSGEFRRVAGPDDPPEELFDRLLQQGLLRNCLEQVRGEIQDSTYQAFRHYVMDEWPVEKVCEAMKMNPPQVHAIKWRVTKRIAELMHEMTGDGE